MSETLPPNPNQMPTEEQMDATIRQFLGTEAVQGAMTDATVDAKLPAPVAAEATPTGQPFVDSAKNFLDPNYKPAERVGQPALTDEQVAKLAAHRGQPVTAAERAGMDAARARGMHTSIV